MYMEEEAGPWHMKYPGLHFWEGQMKDRHMKSIILAEFTFVKQNI